MQSQPSNYTRTHVRNPLRSVTGFPVSCCNTVQLDNDVIITRILLCLVSLIIVFKYITMPNTTNNKTGCEWGLNRAVPFDSSKSLTRLKTVLSYQQIFT